MPVYHIKKDGTPGVCSAEGPCPLGGAEAHFPTEEAAYEEAQLRMENMFGVIQNDTVEINNLSSPGSQSMTISISEIQEVIPRGNMTIIVKSTGEKLLCDTPYNDFEKFGL